MVCLGDRCGGGGCAMTVVVVADDDYDDYAGIVAVQIVISTAVLIALEEEDIKYAP